MARLRRQRSQWDQLGRSDPLWAILTDPARRHGGWRAEEFFLIGEQQIEGDMARAAAFGLPAGRSGALDFGCGVGRLTQALALYFDRVTGVDISPVMIEQAHKYNRRGERCRYLQNDRDDLSIFPGNSFDLVYSRLTLQHMPPRHICRYLAEFVRVLRPGGLLLFQLPEAIRNPRMRVTHGVHRLVMRHLLRTASVMEMYGVKRDRVAALLNRCGAAVLSVEEDDSAGPEWLSCRYLATR